MKFSSLALRSTLLSMLWLPFAATAESQLTIGTGTASARLNFQVIVPRVLFLAVGTGSASLSDNPTIDTVIFDYSGNPQDLGLMGAPAGAITGASVPVRVLGNNGQVVITASGSGAGLSNGTDTIAWSEITGSSSAGTLPIPAVGQTVNPTLNSGKLTNRTATWTYSYSNSNIVAPGSYAGEITYTASMP